MPIAKRLWVEHQKHYACGTPDERSAGRGREMEILDCTTVFIREVHNLPRPSVKLNGLSRWSVRVIQYWRTALGSISHTIHGKTGATLRYGLGDIWSVMGQRSCAREDKTHTCANLMMQVKRSVSDRSWMPCRHDDQCGCGVVVTHHASNVISRVRISSTARKL